jgi:3-keto-5-aminohexanoate cleavage enzyme
MDEKEIPRTIIQMYGNKFLDIESLHKWDIPEKIAIKAAVVGAFFDRNQNPYQPYTTDEIKKEAMACIEAGATAIHLHVRDENGMVSGDVELFKQIVNPIKEKYGDKALIDGCAIIGPTFKDQVKPVTEGLFEEAPVNPTTGMLGDTVRITPPEFMQLLARTLEKSGARPNITVHDTSSIDNAKRYLIDTGIIKKPYHFLILPALPGLLYMPNQIAMCEALLFCIHRLKEIDPECIISVCASGRASVYVSTLAMLLGCHVRIGMEDTIWKYPHKDEMVKSTSEMVKSAVEVARHLGREVMSANEYRKMVGLK